MALLVPVSLTAQETSGAMLRSSGEGTLVNGSSAPASIAIFPNDQVQTPKNIGSRIEVTGSTADVNPETIVQYQAGELVLDHGSLSVNTIRGLRVRVGCITITPVHDNAWTHYDVRDVNGKVEVAASKDDVYISARSKNLMDAKEIEKERSNRTIVHQGEQKSREEKCAGAYKPQTAMTVTGIGAWLNSPYAIATGAGIIIFTTCYALCQGSEPSSPICPSEKCPIP